MEKFGIITNIEKDNEMKTTKQVLNFLKKNKKHVLLTQEVSNHLSDDLSGLETRTFYKEIDCALILGGDGTIISAARELALHKTPIVGINLGTLGFLAEVEKEEALKVLEKIINNDYIVENRMMLEAIIKDTTNVQNLGIALNDVVVTRNGFTRIIELAIYVNEQIIEIVKADGVIISTPTGSTAYNLSAGGPILNPTTEMMVITPICPHSLTSRSIVVSAYDQVSIKVLNVRSKHNGDVMLTLDGQIGHKLSEGDIITINRSQYKTRLIKLKHNNYYALLKKKIGSK